MFVPVPEVTAPRGPRPKRRAASSINAAGTPVRALHQLGREVAHRVPQRLESIRVLLAEVAVVQALGEDHPQHATEERGILAGLDLEMQVRASRQLRVSRVDADHLEPAAPRVSQPLEGIDPGQSAVGPRVHRDERVHADHHDDVRALEAVHAGRPEAVARRRDEELGWLVDAAARVVGGGTRCRGATREQRRGCAARAFRCSSPRRAGRSAR